MKNSISPISRGDAQYALLVAFVCIVAFVGSALSETFAESLTALSVPCTLLIVFSIRSTFVNGVKMDFDAQDYAATQAYMLGFLSSLSSMMGALVFEPDSNLIQMMSSKLIITIVALFCFQCMTQVAKTWRNARSEDHVDLELSISANTDRLSKSADALGDVAETCVKKTEEMTGVLKGSDLTMMCPEKSGHVILFNRGS